ncbi:MAG TPA: hypothetical protein GX405_05720 [Rhizobiales bacterium]|nr:hypothetical protein [Hyphomicrobiales bacterium]
MLRTRRNFLVLFLATALAGYSADISGLRAEKISTTSCKAAADRTKTQDGKTYKCTGCQACTTTTCETGGTLACTNTTTTTCSCTEASAAQRPGTGVMTTSPGVLDPGSGGRSKNPAVRPPGLLQKLQ